MNTKAEFEIKPLSLILGIIGAAMAFFTINGGFFGDWAAGMEPSGLMKLTVTIGAFIIGFIWGSFMGGD